MLKLLPPAVSERCARRPATMDGFDTLTMSSMAYMTNPMPLPSGAGPDPLVMPMLPLDHIDHSSTFDTETFTG